ncbi:uncharacterized protein BCR38DRAFT_410832 [Pseudomassariella vexata]|uniref:Uncharacterized protein n=1 Tax=Pseudomassariella vexata TaxID=1141098 RepID=A0A1Y2DTE0_9PEZI|nr:uncharacterized protein BCR38DRAFT_410832 [Pseudomassariella vexata]ORY62414.1 hypothetical protein BCR38DRAFT_410832 [Pseudomassariella vexata]
MGLPSAEAQQEVEEALYGFEPGLIACCAAEFRQSYGGRRQDGLLEVYFKGWWREDPTSVQNFSKTSMNLSSDGTAAICGSVSLSVDTVGTELGVTVYQSLFEGGVRVVFEPAAHPNTHAYPFADVVAIVGRVESDKVLHLGDINDSSPINLDDLLLVIVLACCLDANEVKLRIFANRNLRFRSSSLCKLYQGDRRPMVK